MLRLPESRQKRFFQRGTGRFEGQARVRRDIATRVEFQRLNLMDESWGIEGGFDAIFCRNVLMYFDEEAAQQTLTLIYSLLKDGGYLLLGHAESLLPLGSGFKPVQFGRELVHRK